MSTGTGSSGWLYSARQITPYQLQDIQKMIGSLDVSTNVNEMLAQELSE